jgi:hypothetical protein
MPDKGDVNRFHLLPTIIATWQGKLFRVFVKGADEV